VQLDDSWLEFARAGKVSAFLNQERPELRNEFWTKPEVELDIAKDAGAQARRADTAARCAACRTPSSRPRARAACRLRADPRGTPAWACPSH
jgi:hypothetical protein